MKGHMQDGKFHPHTQYKGVRKKKEPFKVVKTEGIPMQKLISMQRADVGRRKRSTKFRKASELEHQLRLLDMTEREMMEWEDIVDSDIVKVKHEMMDGRPITSVRFANGEEWFEFDSIDHQEEFMRENDLHKHVGEVGEFIEVDHPMIAGFVTTESGKVLFGEKEDSRFKRDGRVLTQQITFFEDPSHGFYKVPNSLLNELGIQDEITKSSKRLADFTFLEEDQDATTFFNALKKKGIDVPEGKIEQKYFDSPNENPASPDFRLCDECGETFSSVESLKRHKGKDHKSS